jgi:hypothetical protein
MKQLDYQTAATIGEAVYDALGRETRRGSKGVDTTVESRKIVGERVADRLRDFGMKIVRDEE